MSLTLLNLNGRTRKLMQEELAYDLSRQQLHISPYLSGQGIHDFANLLQAAIANGDETTLAQALSRKRRIARTAHRKRPQGGFHIVSVPHHPAKRLTRAHR